MSLAHPVAYQHVASTELPTDQRYEQWLMPMLACCEAPPPTERQRRDFDGRLVALTSSSSELYDLRCDDFDGIHSPRSIRRGDQDELALVYLMRGRVLTRHEDDADLVTGAGQFLLLDSRQAKHTRFQQPRFVQINLPRSQLHSVLGGASLSQISQAVSQAGLASLLASQLSQFSELGSRLTPREQLGLLEATESLAVSVVESVCLHHSLFDDGRQRLPGLYAAARQHIRAKLSDPGLNGAAIAAALGCSRATLYRAFSEYDESPADYIREMRLSKAHRMLQVALPYYSIADIAACCGFIDYAGFSRLFRQHFGVRPSDVRRR